MIGLDGSGGMRSWPILSYFLYTACHKRWHTHSTTDCLFLFFCWGGGGCGVTQMDKSTSSNDEQRAETDHLTLGRWVQQIVS